ncbi:phosphopentomutase, partial [Bacillus cereus]|nr:phosphopentomutase [Bacillus cereus]
PSMKEGVQEFPLRQTFADIGATVAENVGVKMTEYGTSFLN